MTSSVNMTSSLRQSEYETGDIVNMRPETQ